MAKRHLALMTAVLLIACAAGPERVTERRVDDAPAQRGEELLRRAVLDGHDAARTALGVGGLAWDDTLAAHARAHAETLARERRFAHAEQPMGAGREGENLWTGTRGAYRYEEMIGHWAEERRDFVNEPVPRSSRSLNWAGVAHYAQMVWRGTTRVGCAMASNEADEYLVCRYSPAGNVVGVRAY